jgi:hypothetical protein
MDLKVNTVPAGFVQRNKPDKGEYKSIFDKIKQGAQAVKSDIESLDSRVNDEIKFFSPLKKAKKTIDQVAEGSPLLAGFTAARLINDLPQDIHLMKKALTPGPNPYWNCQKPFDMVPGTLIEKTALGRFLNPFDKNLFDLGIVQKGLKKIGMTGVDVIDGRFKINGSSISKVAGGAALRTPLLYMGMAGALEVPNIFKAENKPKAIARAAINVGLGSYIWSILGCIGRFYGPLPEFIFAGIGAIFSGKISNAIADLLLGKDKRTETAMP